MPDTQEVDVMPVPLAEAVVEVRFPGDTDVELAELSQELGLDE